MLKNKDKYFKLALLLVLISTIFRIIYAIRIPYFTSLHDQGFWLDSSVKDYYLENNGHINYMQYIFEHRTFPNTYDGQFYHPPLFHIIGFIVYALCHSKLSLNDNLCMEIIQVVNVLISSLGCLFVVLALDKLKIKKYALLLGSAFISFHPSFYATGINLSNDALAISLAYASLYFCICWYQDIKYRYLILTALCVGLSMISKLNGGLISIGIAILLFYKLYDLVFIQKKWDEYKKIIISQMIIFVLIAFPIGLSWSIRNYIKFNIPINYALQFDENDPKYIKENDITRLSIPSIEELSSINRKFIPQEERNIISQSLLTELFDENIVKNEEGINNILSLLLRWDFNILKTIIYLLMIYSLFKDKENRIYHISMFICTLFIIVLYIKFNYDFPYLSATNFRYIAITLMPITISFSLYLNKRKTNYILSLLIILFASLSTLVYLLGV